MQYTLVRRLTLGALTATLIFPKTIIITAASAVSPRSFIRLVVTRLERSLITKRTGKLTISVLPCTTSVNRLKMIPDNLSLRFNRTRLVVTVCEWTQEISK